MSYYIKANTANDAWKELVNQLMDETEEIGSRAGKTYELLHTFITIENPAQKWIYDRIPPMSIAFALAELVWIMNGEDDATIINFWNPILKKFAGCDNKYYGAYGKRIRSHFGFDQLQQAYLTFLNNSDSRQVVIQIYDTEKDFPFENGKPRNDDIPCNVCSILKVRNNKLEWSQIMRSNDVFLGLPYNIVQFTGLQEILAGWLGLEVGTYNHYSDSLHLYLRDEEKIDTGHEVRIENKDSLAIDKTYSEKLFKDIYERMKKLSSKRMSEKEILEIGKLESRIQSYNNIMLIIAAYVAHKYRYIALEKELLSQNTNEIYSMIWNKWVEKG